MFSVFNLPDWTPLLLVFLLIIVVQRGLVIRVFRSMVLRPPQREAAEWEILPLYLRERVAAVHPALQEAGFAPLGGYRSTGGARWIPLWTWRWLHPATGTVLWLHVRDDEWTRQGEEHWGILTRFPDGTDLITLSSAADPAGASASAVWQIENHPGTDLWKLWERHVARVQAHAQASRVHPMPLATEAVEPMLMEKNRLEWEALRADRDIYEETADGSLRFRWKWILRHGFALAQGERKAMQAQVAAQRGKAAGAVVPAPPAYSEEARDELDLAAFRMMEAGKQARRLSPRARTLVALVSLAIFAAFLWWRGEWELAAIVTGVLFFHEGGHWAAMRWFGSRDTSMLFIPFFGGVAIQNDRPNVKPWQHVVILLAGPLPGLLIGLGLGAWMLLHPTPPWVGLLVLVLILLNAFNLLVPVLPLDGGQLVGIALFSRTPRLAVAFKVVSALALIAGSTLLGLGPFLWIVGLAFLLRIPVEWRTAAIHRDLRREAEVLKLPDTGEEDWLRRIFRRLRGPKFDGPRAPQRYAEALRLVSLVRHPGARWGTAIFALAGWLAPLWLPIALLAPLRWHGQWQFARVEEQARAAGLPRPDDLRRERDERARSLPSEQNAAIALKELAPLLQERTSLMSQRYHALQANRAVSPDDAEGRRLRALDTQVTTRLEEASRRPSLAFAAPELPTLREAENPRVLAAMSIGADAARTYHLNIAGHALSSVITSALNVGDFAAAARNLKSTTRLAALVATSAEAHAGQRSQSFLFTAIQDLDAPLARLTPSSAAVAGMDQLAATLPASDWPRQVLQNSAPRDRAWTEADIYRRLQNQARGGPGLPWTFQVYSLIEEWSPFAPVRRTNFVEGSARIQASFSDPTRPWGWDPPPQAGKATGAMGWLAGESTYSWRAQRDEFALSAARLELIRAALAWHRARLGGRAPEWVEDLRAPFLDALPRHPLTGEPMRLERGRSGRLQLSFAGASRAVWPLEAAAENESAAREEDDEESGD